MAPHHKDFNEFFEKIIPHVRDHHHQLNQRSFFVLLCVFPP
jgi:hypothetical protein